MTQWFPLPKEVKRYVHTKSPTWSESEVTRSCPTLYNPVDCSLPGSSLNGILQAWILEWAAISFSSNMNVLSNIIHNSQKVNMTQVSIKNIYKQDVVFLHNEI